MTIATDTDALFGRSIEMMVLGCMITGPDGLEVGSNSLTQDDFYFEDHRTLFIAVQALHRKDRPVDVHIATEELNRLNKLGEVGGINYLVTLAQYVGTSANIEEYCSILREYTARRSLKTAGEALSSDIVSGKSPAEAIANVLRRVQKVEQEQARSDSVSIGDVLSGTSGRPPISFQNTLAKRTSYFREHGKPFSNGLSTGLIDLDNKVSLLEPTNLMILAARPAMGKTALALSIGAHVCFEQKHPVGFISLEMGAYQLAERLVSQQSGISGSRIKRGELSEVEQDSVLEAEARISKHPFLIVDTVSPTITHIASIAKSMAKDRGIRLLIIDYIGLLQVDRPRENRQNEVAEISRKLKILAMELDIPILCLSQLSREVEKRSDHKPLLADLRDSGGVEQDADSVVFIMRRDYYDPTDKPGEAELFVKKNRHGPEAAASVVFNKETGLFSSLAPLRLLRGGKQ